MNYWGFNSVDVVFSAFHNTARTTRTKSFTNNLNVRCLMLIRGSVTDDILLIIADISTIFTQLQSKIPTKVDMYLFRVLQYMQQ